MQGEIVIKLFLKLLIKDENRHNDTETRCRTGAAASGVGIFCNVVLFAVKFFLGIKVGSIAITADAVNNIADAASSMVSLLGFRLSRRPPDEEHPYGHARYEYISTLVISMLIVLAGAEMLKSSVKKIITPSANEFSIVVAVILLFTIAVKHWMSYFYNSIAKLIDSGSLYAAAKDSRNDVIVTSAVLVSAAVNIIFKIDIDGFVGSVVSVFILASGINTAKETVSRLLGKRVDNSVSQQIYNIIAEYKEILGAHDLMIHDYGPGKVFASLHVEMSYSMNAMYCHDVIDNIEKRIYEQLKINIVIHCDPISK